MLKNIFISLTILLSLTSCVETVVLGTVAAGVVILSDGSVFDLSQDSRIKSSIEKIYKEDPDRDEYKNIKVNVYNGKVMLTGHVSNKTHKQNAYNKAKTVREGIEVLDEIMIFGPDYKTSAVSDSFISSQISLKLKAASGVTSGNYEYDVVDGAVFIMGRSESREELFKVTDIISRVKGVNKVVSYIVILKNQE